MKRIILFFFFVAVIGLFSKKASSTGTYMLHFTYKHLYGLTWQVTTEMFINCDYYGSISQAVNCAYHDTCNYQTKMLSWGIQLSTLPNGAPFNTNCYFNNCAGTLTMCDSPFNATGIVAWRQTIYLDTITLPEPCGLWKFSRGAVSQANYRDPWITNIAPNTHTYYHEALLNADSTKPYSSALWQRPMFMYAYENEPTQWHLPVTDPDGDSLVFTHVAPRKRNAQLPNPLDTLIFDIPFLPQYSLNTEPFSTFETWKFNPLFPSVQFTAAPNQLALLCFRVDEYRNGVFMGATFRDVLIKTLPAVHIVPRRMIDIPNAQNVSFGLEDTVVVYTGQPMNLSTKYYSSAGAVLKHESNIPSVLNNATYNINYLGNGDSIQTGIQWTPTLADTGVYLTVTTLTDTSCTNAGPLVPQDYFHRIVVKKNPNAVSVNDVHVDKKYGLYPNPAQNQIYVNIPQGCTYTIHDGVGRLLLQGESTLNATTAVPISSLPNGVYSIRFANKTMLFSVMR
ncbi:MAG: T9SS type A sorting domain-containing protein [Chitinophagaceae bacterium]|nr:T9SS type A sorting domain-containing protein [Chitinophagaceae bacterium]